MPWSDDIYKKKSISIDENGQESSRIERSEKGLFNIVLHLGFRLGYKICLVVAMRGLLNSMFNSL